MATFEQYKKKDGAKAWLFKAYLGKNQVTGKEVRTTRRGFSSKRAAQDELNKLLVDYNKNNNLLKSSSLTYREAYDIWLETYKNSVRSSTLNTTTNMFNNTILKKFDKQRLVDISPKYCQSVANEWSDVYASFNQLIYYASTVIEHAFKLEIIDSNPFKKITMPKAKNKDKKFTNFLSKEELKKLLEVTKKEKRLHAQIRAISFSGIRIGECIALNWNDIDFGNNTIDINKTVSRSENGIVKIVPPKTPKSIRKLPMDRETMEILNRWKYQQEAEFSYFGYKIKDYSKQLVFPNDDNRIQGSTQFSYPLEKISKQNEIKVVTPHGLRHTHASLLYESGVSMKDIQERLGHSSANFTSDIYTHLSDKAKNEAVDKLSDFLNFD